MEDITSLNTKVDLLTAKTQEERVQVQGLLTGLRGDVQRLSDQIAAGTVATQADLDALGAKIDTAIVDTDAISEAFPLPTPIDTPADPPVV